MIKKHFDVYLFMYFCDADTENLRLCSLSSFILWLERFLSSNVCTSFRLLTISNTVLSSKELAKLDNKSYGNLCWNLLKEKSNTQCRQLTSLVGVKCILNRDFILKTINNWLQTSF